MPTKQISYGSHQGKLGSTKHDPHVNVDPRLYAYRHGGIGSSNRQQFFKRVKEVTSPVPYKPIRLEDIQAKTQRASVRYASPPPPRSPLQQSIGAPPTPALLDAAPDSPKEEAAAEEEGAGAGSGATPLRVPKLQLSVALPPSPGETRARPNTVATTGRSDRGSTQRSTARSTARSREYVQYGSRFSKKSTEQGNARILLQRVRDRLETSSHTMKDHYMALNPYRENGISVKRLKAFVNGFHCGFSDDTLDVLIENKFGLTEDGEMVPYHMFSEVFRPPNLYADKFDANEVRTYKTTIDENQLHLIDGEPTQPLSHREKDDMEHLSHQSVCAWMEARFGTVKNAFRQFDANKDGAVDMEEMYDRLVQEQTVLGIPNENLSTLMRWCEGKGTTRMPYEEFMNKFDGANRMEPEGWTTKPEHHKTTKSTRFKPLYARTPRNAAPLDYTTRHSDPSPMSTLREEHHTDFRTVRQLSKSFEPLAGYGARRLTFPERSLKRDGSQFTPNHGSYEGAAHVSRAAESKNPVEGEAAFARHLPLSKSKADNIHVAALSQPLPAALRQGLNSYEPISQQLVEMDQLHQTQIKRDAVERRHWRKKLGEFRALRSQADQVERKENQRHNALNTKYLLSHKAGLYDTDVGKVMHYQGEWYKDCAAATVCYDQPNRQAMQTCMRGTCACRPFTSDSPLRSRQTSHRNKSGSSTALRPHGVKGFPEVVKPAAKYYSDFLPADDYRATNPHLSPKKPTYHTY